MSYRFAAVAIAALILSYWSVQWLVGVRQEAPSTNAALMPSGAVPLKPSAKVPVFRQVDPAEYNSDPLKGDNDEVRDGLRRAVHDTAKDLIKTPCNDDLKKQYIAAATNYASAQLSIAPCMARNTCNEKTEAQLDLLAKTFKTRFDDTIRDRMYEVHRTGTIREGDFGKDVVGYVAILARDLAINPLTPADTRREWLESRGAGSCQP